MDLECKFKVIKVDESYKTMIVRFSLEGYTDINQGVPLPPVNVSLTEHIARYVPVVMWAMQKHVPVINTDIMVGDSGTLVFNDDKLKMPTAADIALNNEKLKQLKEAELENAVVRVLSTIEVTTI